MKILTTIILLSMFAFSQLAVAANHNTTRSNQAAGVAAPSDVTKNNAKKKKARRGGRTGRNPQTGK